MTNTAIQRLAKAIDYPDEVPAGALSYAFAVDDGEILARETGGRLLLSRVLWRASDAGDDEIAAHMPADLAGFAAGRVLREEAVLAWDPNEDAAILWQDVSSALADEKLARFFELFATSCDWWLERVTDVGEAEPVFPDMMIMP